MSIYKYFTLTLEVFIYKYVHIVPYPIVYRIMEFIYTISSQ